MNCKYLAFLVLSGASSLALNSRYAKAANDMKEYEVQTILQKMESYVLAFRDELERVYSARCDTKTLTDCAESNFNDCSSTFPGQQCMEAEELVIGRCGDGISCNALWDKKLSTVSFPAALAQAPLSNPTDPEIIESACYSRLAEQFMIDQYQDAEEYWSTYGVQPSWAYFGAHNGMFRKIPAVHQEQCGLYDHRRRPWFVAASSGPKDVVLVLDTSGSMNDYGRMSIAKEAAITVVETLTVADRVAVIAFSDTASQIGGYDQLIRATSENKKSLIEAIKQLKANGATNFYDAFDKTFKALDQTIRNESTSGCNIAVLFMTDGQITAGLGHSEVIDLVNERTEQLATNFNRQTTVFTYSLGVQADHDTTKMIACSTNGIWTPVDDQTGDLVTAMSSYYKLYALGLGEGGNDDFAAWVEPYAFANPAGKIGTTVSVPVYDRSVSPPLFLGVVAIDIFMDAFEQILGEVADSSNMLDRFVQLSTARCPKIEMTECELDALRFLGGGEGATCGVCNATTYAGIVPEKCPFQSDWPNNLWHNTEMIGKTYEDRACCEAGTNVPSDVCQAIRTASSNEGQHPDSPSSNSNIGLIVGIVVAVVVVALIVLVSYHRRNRTITVVHQMGSKITEKTKATTNEQSNGQQDSVYVGLSIVTPPSAPPANPAYNAN